MNGRSFADATVAMESLFAHVKEQPQSFQHRSDSDDEAFLDIAVQKWLPAVFPTSAESGGLIAGRKERHALEALALVLASEHKDLWLSSLLASPPNSRFRSGVQKLSAAIAKNAAGDASGALSEAQSAERFFQAGGSAAGAARARLEIVYALQRSQRGDRCLLEAGPLTKQIGGKNYAWIRAQLHIEEANCHYMIEDLSTAQQIIEKALQETEADHFGTLHLRSLGIAASIATDKGDWAAAWSIDHSGLALYWSGAYPALRAWQFYTDLAISAQEAGDWRLALPLIREGVSTVSATPNRTAEAQARYWLATVALEAGESGEAAEEFESATRIYASLPKSDATQIAEADGEISLALLEARRGDLERASAHLAKIDPAMIRKSSYTIPLHFYEALSEIEIRRGRNAAAEATLRSAVEISETGLQSLASESERLAWDRQTANVYRRFVGLKFRYQQDPTAALAIWEWYKAAPLRSHRLAHSRERSSSARSLAAGWPNDSPFPSIPLPNPTEIQKVASSLTQQTIVSFALLPEGIAIWKFDDRGITSSWTAVTADEFERVARRFAQECADPASDVSMLRRDAHQLYLWLIEPIARTLLDGRTLVIETDGILAQIPLQALINDANEYLGSRFAIVISPGVYFAMRLRAPSRFSGQQNALVVGAPTLAKDIAEQYPELPAAEQEARSIANRFVGARHLLGRDATLEAVERQLTRAEVFHFAGHAFSIAGRGGLLLAGSETQEVDSVSVLSAERLRNTSLNRTRLAVLSSCSTGSGDAGLAAPESLVRAFLSAGVAQVVASKWNVDSATTANFMEAFYASLLSGDSVAASVRSAAAALRGPRATMHPYYWAVFDVYGRW